MFVTGSAELSLEQKVGQMFFIGLPGAALDAEAEALLHDISPGGVCLFARNIRERRQTRDLLDAVAGRLAVRPLLSLDQEGGLVDRLRRVLEPMPAADLLRNRADAERIAGLTAEAVRILGFNMNFAPVVDVIDERRRAFSNGLHSRAMGASADEAAGLAASYLNALDAGGCVGCVKHFPGLGAAEVDSHEELPVVGVDPAEFEAVDLAPYRALIGEPATRAVMVAHAAYPNIDLQEKDRDGRLLPSSLSGAFVTGLLRERLAFGGVVITDDLEMGAIVRNYGIGEACRMAVLAGADMLAICAGTDAIREGFAAVNEAVRSGEIGEDRIEASLMRISELKSVLSPPLAFDEARLDQISTEIAELKASL